MLPPLRHGATLEHETLEKARTEPELLENLDRVRRDDAPASRDHGHLAPEAAKRGDGPGHLREIEERERASRIGVTNSTELVRGGIGHHLDPTEILAEQLGAGRGEEAERTDRRDGGRSDPDEEAPIQDWPPPPPPEPDRRAIPSAMRTPTSIAWKIVSNVFSLRITRGASAGCMPGRVNPRS